MPDSVSQSAASSKSAAAAEKSPLTNNRLAAGFIAPIIGRTALRSVNGYYNFPLIGTGETVTQGHIDRAQHLGRLYELIAATETE